jgi:hypothetical protein
MGPLPTADLEDSRGSYMPLFCANCISESTEHRWHAEGRCAARVGLAMLLFHSLVLGQILATSEARSITLLRLHYNILVMI